MMYRERLLLNFHRIENSSWFEKIILLLKSKFLLTELENFIDNNHCLSNKKLCHLTFDDGDMSFFISAFPVINKYKIPCTLFVSPKIIINQENFWFQEVRDYNPVQMNTILSRELSLPPDSLKNVHHFSILKNLSIKEIQEITNLYQKETNTLPKYSLNMSLKEISEVLESGHVTIGAHTINHPILLNENIIDVENEITGSIKGLEELLNIKVKYFAYPNGIPNIDFGEREIEIVRKNGIQIGVSTECRYVSKKDNPLVFPRIGLSHGNLSFIKAKLILGANWDRVKSLRGSTEIKNRKYIASLLKYRESLKM